jgi:hypothetical protein
LGECFVIASQGKSVTQIAHAATCIVMRALESKADMQNRGQASPDDGDALALTFAQPVEPAEVEEEYDEEEFGGYGGHSSSGGWMR